MLALHLDSERVDPAVLNHLPQLQLLKLHYCTVAGDNTSALLAATGRLRHLQHLSIEWPEHYEQDPGTVPAAAAFAALTASQHLVYLRVHDVLFPPGAVQAMFPVGRLQTNLQHLLLTVDEATELVELASALKQLPNLSDFGVHASEYDVCCLMPCWCSSMQRSQG